MTVEVKRLSPQAILPTRATPGSAGLDLHACIDEPIVLEPGAVRILPTGFAIAAPEGTVALVVGRSGLGIRHGLTLANCVGVIDSDFRGELQVGLKNYSDRPYTVAPGERIAQLLLVPILTPALVETAELSQTARGTGGLGSTGTV